MISIIITAFREERSIGGLLESIVKPEYSNLTFKEDFEILLVCPDHETNIKARETLNNCNFDMLKYLHIVDDGKGKPTALNLAISKAKGDILILTDGDVNKIGENSFPIMINRLRSNTQLFAVCAQVLSIDRKNNVFGYWGHLLASAAHKKRLLEMTENNSKFAVLSGYLYALKKIDFKLPEDILSDDAYISYKLLEEKKKILYEPKATVYVKYPQNFHDWIKQKSRSLGGYIQLNQYKFAIKNKRNLFEELKYFFYPIEYSKNFKELVWSLLLYPARLYLWFRIFIDRVILRKSFNKTWVRIESTK